MYVNLGTFTNKFWISATDLGRESDFYWDTTGDFVGPYTSWGTDEPNNDHGKEDCVGFYRGLWNDLPCTYTYRYICEKKN
jgi:Lectin C-type domain